MKLQIAILAGDGIGPEVTREAVGILKAVAEFGGHDFRFTEALIGGVAITAEGTPLPQAISTLSKMRFGCVGVLDADGRLCGIVTDGDIARNLGRSLAELNVDDIMTIDPKTVRATTLATGAMAVLNNNNISALLVVDEDRRPIGLVHFHDLLRIGVA